ncbi:Retrotransposon gag protein [Corchorus olitorius]|uniref:Retrotransposon gag protein n=1 Tax=Corchorus olitorius TaxID=93759 RepID=A0A1R3JYS1_9ROSI|nr:Retrotransposon gag protein [Corchorus olitorius]
MEEEKGEESREAIFNKDSQQAKEGIMNIQQGDSESLCDYCQRSKYKCEEYPNHNIPQSQLLKHFYEGLKSSDKALVNAAFPSSIFDEDAGDVLGWIGVLIKGLSKNRNEREQDPLCQQDHMSRK